MKPDKESLLEEYKKEGVSISSLARKYNTHRPTVRSWLIEYGIERKTHQQASREANNLHRNFTMPSKEILEDQYKVTSIKDLEKKYSVSQATIYMWLNHYKINISPHHERIKIFIKKVWRDKEKVEEIYNDVKNIQLLANELGCSYSKAKETLYYYDIERYQKVRTSVGQETLFNWLCEVDPEGEWKKNDRVLIHPQEIDILSNKRKVAIEYCGVYWHSETWGGKDKNYHLNKLIKVKDVGYTLYTFFEFLPLSKIQNFLEKKLGLNNYKIYARDTIFEEINYNDIKLFEEENHLGGSRGAERYFILKHDGGIVQSMSFGKSRFNKAYDWEMIRFTSGPCRVVGGASKLFENAKKIIEPKSLVTYSDRRYGEGGVYNQLGLKLFGSSDPNYWYFNKNNPLEIYSRVKFQKHKLENLLEIFNPNETEYQNMLNNKYDRFWDCGNNIYVI